MWCHMPCGNESVGEEDLNKSGARNVDRPQKIPNTSNRQCREFNSTNAQLQSVKGEQTMVP